MKLLSITAAAATLLAVPALTWTIEDAHGRVFQGSESDAGCHRYVTFPKGSKITYKVAEGYSLDFFTDKHCTVDKPAVGFSGSRKDAEMYREGQSFMFCPDKPAKGTKCRAILDYDPSGDYDYSDHDD